MQTQTTPLTRVVERTMELAPVSQLEVPIPYKSGYMKVRLTYLTNEPKHYRSYQLSTMYGFSGPFMEEVYILMPVRTITSVELSIFHPAFVYLKKHFIVSKTARLVKATLLDEDINTLAYTTCQ
jgi:hypothetical protein